MPLFILLSLILTSCASSQLLREKDYQYSVNAYRSGDSKLSLSEFPKKEKNGFITSIEEGWLNIWNETPEVKALLKQVKTFDDRRYLSVTREAKTFLVQESEEGYIPSEHEVVVLHLVSAMNYMQLKKWEDAAVEARLAGFYLQNQFNQNQKHFDDPALRLWLAGVWTALGEWESAQVDLRRAAELSGDKNLRTFAEGNIPENLTITFNGVAPEVEWKRHQMSPEFKESEQIKGYAFSFSSDPWFKHHTERNSVLRDILTKSNYMSNYLGIKAAKTSQRAAVRGTAFTLGTLGVAAGLVVAAGGLYLAQYAGSGDAIAYLVGGGLWIAKESVDGAAKFDKEEQTNIDNAETEDFENLKIYRFVRFMPKWISIDTEARSGTKIISKKLELKSPTSKTNVRFVNNF